MRKPSMENSVWLRGFVVKSLGGGVRVSPRLLKIQWICNISIGSPSHHCELDHMWKIDRIGIFCESPEIHLCIDRISTELNFIENAGN